MNALLRTAIVGAGLTVAVGAVPATSFASGGGGGVRASGSCSGHSTWNLKAKPDDGRLEVEFEVDSNRVGQTWSVRLADNGTQFFSGTRQTVGPSGSFTVRKLTANRAGTDRIVARAANAATGEVCRGTVSL